MKGLSLAGFALGLAVHGMLGWQAIRAQSPTFDEPLHLTAGYVYWKTRDFRLNGLHHPPLSSLVAAAPLLALDPPLPLEHPLWLRPRWQSPTNQYAFANAFLYHTSGFPEERLMNAGRLAILACSLAFLLCLWEAANAAFGPVAAWTTFALGVFSPEFLAHGTLVTTDFLFSAFFFLFFYALARWEKAAGVGRWASAPSDPVRQAGVTAGADGKPGRTLAASAWAADAGASAGFAFASKFSAVLIGPVLLWWLARRGFKLRLGGRSIAIGAVAAFLALTLASLGAGWPTFIAGLQYTLGRVQEGRATFLLGQGSTSGWWYYFPVVFLLKSSPVLLASLAAAAALALKERWRPPWFLVGPPTVYFAIACASSVQIGHRHILPVYPFLYVLAGGVAATLWGRKWTKAVLAAAALFVAADAWASRPYFIAYFNPLSGARQRPHDYLTDSNVDWGQGMRALREYLARAGVGAVHLSYFGTAEPEAHGIRHSPLLSYTIPPFPGEDADISREPKALLVVSATNFRGTYFSEKDIFGWLSSRRPDAFLAKSLLVFDITQDAESHERLAGLYRRSGRGLMAERESAWARRLRAAEAP